VDLQLQGSHFKVRQFHAPSPLWVRSNFCMQAENASGPEATFSKCLACLEFC
jgi:hypothetical protein